MNNCGQIPRVSPRLSSESPTNPEHRALGPSGLWTASVIHPILISLGRHCLRILSGLPFAVGHFEGTGLCWALSVQPGGIESESLFRALIFGCWPGLFQDKP